LSAYCRAAFASIAPRRRRRFGPPALQGKYDLPTYHNRQLQRDRSIEAERHARICRDRAARLFRATSGDTTLAARVVNCSTIKTESTREPLYILLAASGLLLLIGCAERRDV